MNKPYWILIFALLFGAQLAVAQKLGLNPNKRVTQYNLDSWTTENGLRSNGILASLQTRDGYLWFATENGLHRFDGVRFTIFSSHNTPAFKNNAISSLCQDRAGRLWVGTLGGGLLQYSNNQFVGYNKNKGLTDLVVQALSLAPNGNLIIGTSRGLFQYTADSITAVALIPLRQADIAALFHDKAGDLWVGTKRDGLYRMKGNSLQHYAENEGLSNPFVRSITQDSKGQLWVGTNGGGLSVLEGGNFRNYTTKQGLLADYVNAVHQDQMGNLWVATASGLCRLLPGGSFEHMTTKEGLTYNSVLSLGTDLEGSLWIGTSRGGINRLRDGRFTTYYKNNGLCDDIVHGILRDSLTGSIYVATDGGLNKWQNGSFVTINDPAGKLKAARVRGLMQDREGNIWVATYGSLVRMRGAAFTSYGTAQGLSSDLVRLLMQDSKGRIWIGTRTGLSLYHNGKFTNYKNSTVPALASGVIQSLYEDKRGTIWIGTDGNGLVRMEGDAITVLTTDMGLPSNVIYKITEDSTGGLWMGTNAGLCFLKDGRPTAFGLNTGLMSETIFQIIPDRVGNCWFTTDLGIFRASANDMRELANGRIKRLRTQFFGKAEGMRTNECTANGASLVNQDGQLWLATTGGVAVVNPAEKDIVTAGMPVLVQHLMADSTQYTITEGTLLLPPGSRKLEIHYTALTYLVPDKVNFRYKLEGFDDEWVEAGTLRTAYYTNLSPGRYTFKLMARLGEQPWQDAQAPASFEVDAHFYQTWWFYILCAIAAVALIILGYRLRLKQYELRQRQLQVTVHKRTKDLQMAKQQAEEFSHQVLNKNEELGKTLEELKMAQDQLILAEKMASLGQLLAGVAHEINTPIGAINASASNLSKSIPITMHALPLVYQQLTEEQQKQFIQLLDDSITPGIMLTSREERQIKKELNEQLKQMGVPHETSIAQNLMKSGLYKSAEKYRSLLVHPRADEIIDVATTFGKMRMNIENIGLAVAKTQKIVFALKNYSYRSQNDQPVPTNIVDNIETILTIYNNQLKHGITLERIYSDKIPNIHALPDELGQVWTNIIHNAIQAMKGQGILQVEITANEHAIQVAITDNGPGIPDHIQKRIFEPFFTTKPQGEGSGLGLDICRRIIHKHGGEIGVASVPGCTVFRVLLPLHHQWEKKEHKPEPELAMA